MRCNLLNLDRRLNVTTEFNVMKKGLFTTIQMLTIGLLLVGFYACTDDTASGSGGGSSSKTPEVTTNTCQTYGSDYAYFTGEVTDDHDYDILRCGFCWTTSGTPTIDDECVYVDLDEENMFHAYIEGLSPNTTYYFKAFAENKKGVGYGTKKSFTTEDAPVIPEGDEFFQDFDNGNLPSGWTKIDADGDGWSWNFGSEIMGNGYGFNGSNDIMLSMSYYSGTVLYPDNYLVTNRVKIGPKSMFGFYACAQDSEWPSEHFGVAVSRYTNYDPYDFDIIQEWTMTSKDNANGPKKDRGMNEQGTWYWYSVDLSQYAGEEVYIAIRHFNTSDQFYLDVDNVELYNAY